MKYQLALEGGGAKGAYHAGVLRALLEHGYEFDAVVGTSIGALNGVMIAQHKFLELYELWENMYFSKLFNFPDEYAEKLADGQIDVDTLTVLLKNFFTQMRKGGIDTSKSYEVIKKNVDEDLLRESSIRFGLMTYNLTKKTPMPIFIEEIPRNQVADYVMASASFPGFKSVIIDDDKFIDGGIHDNLPINMLIDEGYRNIIAIKTGAIAKCQKVNYVNGLNLQYIIPSEKPGRLLDFNAKAIKRGLKIGYYDGLRFCRKYLGKSYYLKDFDLDKYWGRFNDLKKEECQKLYNKIFNIKKSSIKSDAKNISFDIILIELADVLKLKRVNIEDKKNFFVVLLEEIAKYHSVDRLQVLSVNELIDQIKGRKKADNKKVGKQKSDKNLVIERAFACLF